MFRVKKNISVALRSVRALSSQLSVSKLVLLARHFKDQVSLPVVRACASVILRVAWGEG